VVEVRGESSRRFRVDDGGNPDFNSTHSGDSSPACR
jgi:hypothetical protein